MVKRFAFSTIAAVVILVLLGAPIPARAQQAQESNGVFILGSVLLSIIHLPIKLVTCVGTQAVSGVAYAATFGVPGNYEGGTNGKDIGETARSSCKGDWIVTPQQVKKDYGE
jgi:hypothetical protein